MSEPDMVCDRCGESCADGYEERVYRRDTVTGYQESEIVCSRCLEEEAEEFDNEPDILDIYKASIDA